MWTWMWRNRTHGGTRRNVLYDRKTLRFFDTRTQRRLEHTLLEPKARYFHQRVVLNDTG